MKFKLEENFGRRTLELFHVAGHDAQTVLDESLGGASDYKLFEIACAESRCLITLDMDFSDPLRFHPAASAGIVVIRLPINPSLALLTGMIRQFLRALEAQSPDRTLWVVEPGRIRVHQQEADLT
ncbi:MAG: DUF5615 family PIN-like protein [Kiritimatiellae bacterium]|nr:DUF5615 family PIN-like protein [Verrucomicrobiota bacterium]MCG2660100.1 DUF5615 family PIN-like protein [Kiritimatiellia bacterium]